MYIADDTRVLCSNLLQHISLVFDVFFSHFAVQIYFYLWLLNDQYIILILKHILQHKIISNASPTYIYLYKFQEAFTSVPSDSDLCAT